ncbi:FAD dependent oxidoreductase [Exidia glandulosa HHB12029]|uniref:FAD dependent oxidoreductase n=1 Tax=Exidia glandulosa HHB12029 TaxID=1314781 RepID=A0A165PXP3_EXIGL|nr:FAD dependent oxidoreductase [Exidia glandulosa HHB12029]
MPNQDELADVVICGAGVLGLSVAHTLLAERPNMRVAIVAREMPGLDDYSQNWASPWAACNWFSYSNKPTTVRWETISFERFWDMIPEGIVMATPTTMCWSAAGVAEQIWYQDVVRNYEVLEGDAIPAGYKYGVKYTTITLQPRLYLQKLKNGLEKRGVTFVRRYLPSIAYATAYGKKDAIIVNCTGLGSMSLGGVEDTSMFPIRGQTITVHAPHIKESICDIVDGGGDATYCVPRPDGTCIIGGTFQFSNWQQGLDTDTGFAIFDRASRMIPALLSPETKIVSHNVALRPARMGGMRVEVERVEYPLEGPQEVLPDFELEADVPVEALEEGKVPSKSFTVVHAYGMGPAGYSCSWGIAEDVVKLILSS